MVSNDNSFLREIFSRRNIWVSRLVHEEILERLMRRFAAEETVEGYDMCEFLLKNAPTDDAKVKLSQHEIFWNLRQVISQVIETELGICDVRHVLGVPASPLLLAHIRLNQPDGKT